MAQLVLLQRIELANPFLLKLRKIFGASDYSVLDIFQSKAFWNLSKNLELFKNTNEIVL